MGVRLLEIGNKQSTYERVDKDDTKKQAQGLDVDCLIPSTTEKKIKGSKECSVFLY